jgi:hypothetical protein
MARSDLGALSRRIALRLKPDLLAALEACRPGRDRWRHVADQACGRPAIGHGQLSRANDAAMLLAAGKLNEKESGTESRRAWPMRFPILAVSRPAGP